jgi:hypothetical protein
VLVRAGKHIQGDHFNDAHDHPVLAQVILAVEKVVKTGTSTALGNLVVGFENVLRKADEWQRHFETKEIHIDIKFKSIANISARWRTLEVYSWPSLIEQRILRFEAGGPK